MSVYFWKDNQVVEIESSGAWFPLSQAEELQLLNLFCYDRSAEKAHMRYGMYRTGFGWKHIPFSEFPPEFKAHLLLLGVS